jgi:arylsulfatase A-like enzyme
VIWFGTPHSPFKASNKDNAPFRELDENSKHHYGELVAMDRSIGTLRAGLRELGIEKQTLVWYCSDNGGLPRIEPPTTGGLRGNKGTIFEGGLRVPGIIEWPGKITPRTTNFTACVMDMLPTLLELTETPYPDPKRPLDGISLAGLLSGPADEPRRRSKPICFRYRSAAAIVDGDWKLLTTTFDKQTFELYQLSEDPDESENVAQDHPRIAERLKSELLQWHALTDASERGRDYPEGRVVADHPQPMFWVDRADYQPYLDEWLNRWEYESWIERRRRAKKK